MTTGQYTVNPRTTGMEKRFKINVPGLDPRKTEGPPRIAAMNRLS